MKFQAQWLKLGDWLNKSSPKSSWKVEIREEVDQEKDLYNVVAQVVEATKKEPHNIKVEAKANMWNLKLMNKVSILIEIEDMILQVWISIRTLGMSNLFIKILWVKTISPVKTSAQYPKISNSSWNPFNKLGSISKNTKNLVISTHTKDNNLKTQTKNA